MIPFKGNPNKPVMVRFFTDGSIELTTHDSSTRLSRIIIEQLDEFQVMEILKKVSR